MLFKNLYKTDVRPINEVCRCLETGRLSQKQANKTQLIVALFFIVFYTNNNENKDFFVIIHHLSA